MASCEKCWSDAYMKNFSNGKGQAENYSFLIEERKENPCTPEEQAGKDARTCPKCHRKTIHQIMSECIVCGYLK